MDFKISLLLLGTKEPTTETMVCASPLFPYLNRRIVHGPTMGSRFSDLRWHHECIPLSNLNEVLVVSLFSQDGSMRYRPFRPWRLKSDNEKVSRGWSTDLDFFFCRVNLRSQKRLAASVLKCGQRKIWLDPNEVNEISNANSRKFEIFFGLDMLPYCFATFSNS